MLLLSNAQQPERQLSFPGLASSSAGFADISLDALFSEGWPLISPKD